VVIVHLSLLRTVVPAMDSVTLGSLLVIDHLFKVWIRRVHLLLKVDCLAPDVRGRVFVDFVSVVVELLL
jgi:hypothetical protein